MRNIIRQPVRGEDFFKRPKLIGKIKKALASNMPILLTGPIKSGKTSLLLHLQDTLGEEYDFFYFDAGNSNSFFEYYDDMYEALSKSRNLGSLYQANSEQENYSPDKEIIQILGDIGTKKPLVILIDNFSKILENLFMEESTEEPAYFLEHEQEFRSKIANARNNILFLYTATPKLELIANAYASIHTLNDLYSIEMTPLSDTEVAIMLEALLAQTSASIKITVIQYLSAEIRWLNPFHIQLAFFELEMMALKKNLQELETTDIDEALKKVLGHRYYFENWILGLNHALGENTMVFVLKVVAKLFPDNDMTDGTARLIAKECNVINYEKTLIFLIKEGLLEKVNQHYYTKSKLLSSFLYNHLLPNKDQTVETTKALEQSPKTFKKIEVKKIRIQNIKCFTDVEIPFDSPTNANLLIGTNGKGKSSILQLIALGLINISKVPFTQSWKEVVQKNNTTGSFQLDITIDEKPAAIKCQIDETDTITCTEGTELRKEKQDSFMMLAYGVNRNIKLQEIPPYEDIDPIATLFGENGYLKHIKITTNYERIKSDFPHVRDLINSVLEKSNGGENVVLTKLDANGFYFKTPSSPDVPVPTEALSEGFKSTFAWLLDAIIRIVENGGNPANVEEVTGIILLDEIDLHLHPSWQRTILHSIAGLFPNIQFIVTTHSPFVVQSAGPAGIIALETDTKNNAMTARPPEVTSELSYNAIVREIFKIDFPFSREVEDQMKRFREFELLIRGNKKYDKKEFIQLVLDIADRGVELEGVMRREIRSLERRTGKNFKLWKK